MNAFLLTWNPKITDWIKYKKDREQLLDRGFLDRRWSCGRSKRIRSGDRVYLLRQGLEPKGIIAAGYATSDWFPDTRWNDSSRICNYVKVQWNVFLDFPNKEIISRHQLAGIKNVYWDTQMSGISVSKEAAKLIELEFEKLQKNRTFIPEELPGKASSYIEGAIDEILVNKYERDPHARQACINYYTKNNQITCAVCEFDFESVYGSIGVGFMHIHHIVPLSRIKGKYIINPVKDLVPVCANCHAMLHREHPVVLSVDELKRRMKATP